MSHYVPKALFSMDTNPKTIKGQKYGFKTGVLYLAPYNLSGQNLCPMAEVAGCISACLHTAGNPAHMATKTKGRINKARYFVENRTAFMAQLVREISRENRKIIGQGFKFLVRLNGTSDIRWENIPIDIDAKTAKATGKAAGLYLNIFSVFPEIQFYDYTKIPNRKGIPSNYDLTFSYSGVLQYQKYVTQAINSGIRIAAVFRNKKDIPSAFLGLECVNGDDSDIRHLDPQGVIVALYAKGKAKTDYSGFVVDSARRLIELKAA